MVVNESKKSFMETSFLSYIMAAENNQIWKSGTAVHISLTSHLLFSQCLSLISPSPMRRFRAKSDDPDRVKRVKDLSQKEKKRPMEVLFQANFSKLQHVSESIPVGPKKVVL